MTYVEGTVLGIVFRNDENGYTVVELGCEENIVICVGNLPSLQQGEYVRFYGAYTTHKTYGEQFKVASMEARMPEGDESIRLFLSGGLIKGVGEVLAARIVEEFHEYTFEVIEDEPERLAMVKGVSRKLAQSLSEQLRELKGIRGSVMQLQDMGLTLKQSMAVIDQYGAAAMDAVARNPYRLADEIRGVGFETADRIAAHLGIENYEKQRVRSGLRHVLRRSMDNGHTCQPLAWLVRDTASLLQIPEDIAAGELQVLIEDGVLSKNVYNGVDAIAETVAYNAEAGSALKLVMLCAATPKKPISAASVDGVIGVSKKLSEEQEEALRKAVTSTVCVITGGPGTGKTTILNELISIYEKNGISTALAAPTGRAAKRMEKATGRSAKTIHRLLEYGIGGLDDDDEFSESMFMRDEDNPIEAEAVIIDETSMVDAFLLSSLLRAVAPGTRLLFTGDADQLPSVGPGNVLKDMIASERIPVARLSEVFRQTGNIADNAHRVNRGELPELYPAGDFIFVPASDPEETLELTKQWYTKLLGEGVPYDELQVICPIKRGSIGVYNVNNELRELTNPRLLEKGELTYGERVFRRGDKIMQTTNNYNKEWYVMGTLRTLTQGTGVFNGDIGQILHIDTVERTADMLFDGERLATYEHQELEQIDNAYAVTVHKSQGNEFDAVILPLFYGPSAFLTRNLFYTAITRAKKKLVIIGAKRTVDMMVRNNRIAGRFTALKYELAGNSNFVANLGRRKPSFDAERLLDELEEED